MIKVIFRGSVLTGLGKISDVLAVLISLPILVASVGIESVGLINGAIALSIYFGSFVQYGFLLSGSRDIAGIRDVSLRAEYFWSVLYVQFFFLSLSLLVYWFLAPFFYLSEKYFLECFIFILAAVVRSCVPVYYIQGIHRFDVYPIINLISKFIYISLIVFCVDSSSEVVEVAYIALVANLLMLILSLCFVFREVRYVFLWPDIGNAYRKLISSFDVFIINFAPSLYNSTSIFILSGNSDPRVFGAYSTAVRLVETCITAANSLNEVALPVISRFKNDKGSIIVRRVGVVVGLLVSLSVYLFSDFVVGYMFSGQDDISLYVKMLCAWPFLIFVRNSYGINGLIYSKKERVYRRIILSFSVFGLILAVVTVPPYGVAGAYFTLVVVAAGMAVATYLGYRRSV